MGREFKFYIIRVRPETHQDLKMMVDGWDVSINALVSFLIEEFLDDYYLGESGCVDARAVIKELEAMKARGDC